MDDAGDITDGTVKCGSWDSCSAGTCDSDNLTDAEAVTWDSGSSGGTLIHISNSNGGSGGDQYLIDVTSGSLADDDEVTDGTNTFVVNGAPDSCIITAEVFDDDGDLPTEFTVDGLTTNATNYMRIYAPSDDRHSGTIATGATLTLTFDASNEEIITVSDNYLRIEWLNMEVTENSASDYDSDNVILLSDAGNYPLIRNNIIRSIYTQANAGSNWHRGIQLNNGTNYRTYYIYNNIIYGFDSSAGGTGWGGIVLGASSARYTDLYVYNNTVWGNETGIQFYGAVGGRVDVRCQNNIAIGNDTDFNFDADNTYTENDYNASEDATATGANSLNSGSGDPPVDADFVTAGSDFHLASGATEIDEGNDLGPGDFDTDIDGRDRDTEGDTWDMGADELVSAGAAALPQLIINLL